MLYYHIFSSGACMLLCLHLCLIALSINILSIWLNVTLDWYNLYPFQLWVVDIDGRIGSPNYYCIRASMPFLFAWVDLLNLCPFTPSFLSGDYFGAIKTAKLYFYSIIFLHRISESVFQGYDPCFTSYFLNSLWKTLGTWVFLSSSHHR